MLAQEETKELCYHKTWWLKIKISIFVKSSLFVYVQHTQKTLCAYYCIGLCRYMDSVKLPSSSVWCTEWCVSTNTTVLSDQVKGILTIKANTTRDFL